MYKSPWYFLPSFDSIGFSVQEKKFKSDFQDGRHNLCFPFGKILGISDLQVTAILPTKFQVNRLFGSEKIKIYILKMTTIAAILYFWPKQF